MPISTIGANGLGSGAVTNAKIDTVAATKLTGQVPDANAPSGSVLQVVNAIKTDTFSTTTTGWLSVTGLSAVLTPISASSRILVVYYVSFGQSDSGGNRGAGFRVTRNGSVIAVADAAGSRIQQGAYAVSAQQSEGCAVATQSILDSPSSTSALTYQVQMNWSYGSHTACINRSGRYLDTTEPSQGNWTSGITVMEIAG